MNLIEITQKPVIEFNSIEEIGERVDAELAKYNLDAQIATEENLKDIKKLRTKLNKELEEYEARRKAVKSAIDEPYEKFNKSYTTHIKDKYEKAVSTLKTEIDRVEDGLKKAKKQKISDYFDKVNVHDFLKFEDTGVNVILSTSDKKLKEEVDAFIAKINTDLLLIETQENKERVLVKYYETLDVSQAIIYVRDAVEKEKSLEEASKAKQIRDGAEQWYPGGDSEWMDKREEQLEMTFTVFGAKSQLRKVKEFLEKEGIRYE